MAADINAHFDRDDEPILHGCQQVPVVEKFVLVERRQLTERSRLLTEPVEEGLYPKRVNHGSSASSFSDRFQQLAIHWGCPDFNVVGHTAHERLVRDTGRLVTAA